MHQLIYISIIFSPLIVLIGWCTFCGYLPTDDVSVLWKGKSK